MKMKRRDFNLIATAAAAMVITGCGGGGGGSSGGVVTAGPSPAPAPGGGTGPSGSTPAGSPGASPALSPSVVPRSGLAIGANLELQTAFDGVRYGSGTMQNVNFTAPRASDVQWLAANGYTHSRLPIQWEMLQPMLFDTNANAAARAAIGEPGAFNATYQQIITNILDAHAQAGMKCLIDLHNYCRYRDFVFQPDGSVIGLVKPAGNLYAYTTNANQVVQRICATAPGATLRPGHLSDFWVRAARVWKDHPGFGGYNLMNEPFNMPAPGTTVESAGDNEDEMIWPTFAQAAIDAIRAVDPVNPIYVGGNQWSAAFSIGAVNPGFPLRGANIIYEVHMYLDAISNGQRFDFDTEVARNFSAGFGSVPINLDTGMNRLKIAVDWAAQHGGLKLALTETGMPVDDPRWQEMFQRLVNFARQNGVEFYHWAGGNHWTLHNGSMNFVPGWHQNKTVEPEASGPMKLAAGIGLTTLFDDGSGYAPSGTPATITLWVRGNLAAPVTVAITSDNGGALSAPSVTLPAGANSQASYIFTPAPNQVTTLTYTVTAGSSGVSAPPPRKVYSVADPVALAATNLRDGALALIAKYGACKWEAGDAYNDYMVGSPAAEGQPVRAIADSGWGSSPNNVMEMLNWMNVETDPNLPPPVMRVVNGEKAVDASAPGSSGLWCKKVVPIAGVQPNPRNRTPYDLQDPHFAIALVSVPAANSGVVFQASISGDRQASSLALVAGRPQWTGTDQTGGVVTLTSPGPLGANSPTVLSFTCAPGAQQLRVNSSVVASGAATLPANGFDQMLIGWGFGQFFPQPGFGGLVWGVITGKGAPTAAELQVMERYLSSLA